MIDDWCRPWTKNLPPKNSNGWSHFRCQVKVFDTYWIVYPFSKEVSPKINPLRAITFYDERANDALKFIAPPKPHFFEKIIGFGQFVFPKKKIQRRKIKSCKSSETRFAKVSRRSELCSGGKRPFEISKKIRKRRAENEEFPETSQLGVAYSAVWGVGYGVAP